MDWIKKANGLPIFMNNNYIKTGLLFLIVLLASCIGPTEEIKFLGVKDVIVDAASEPMLKANVFFFNPNTARMRLKKIDIEIFYEGQKVGEINQKLKTLIPSKNEFSIPVEVKLAIKELSIVNTFLSMIGGKTMEMHYKGYLKLTYHGFPVRVPVDFKDDIRARF